MDGVATAFVTLAIFVAGVIYACGKLSARVDSLELWRSEVRGDIRAIRTSLDQLLQATTTAALAAAHAAASLNIKHERESS